MAYTIKDSCLNSTTTTGTGTLTLGSAVTGFQSISAIGDGNSATFAAFEVDANGNRDGDWETFVGTFTSSGTTLTRDAILASSNSGAAVNWAAGTKYVALISADSSVALPLNQICNGRLTLTTATPVTTSDVTASTSVYFAPFRGNRIALYNGYSWQVLTFAELSLSTTGLTAAKPYDVFAYISSGAVAIESLVWTDDTNRATALTTQDGVLVKSGATDRRYLGTFYTFDNSGTVSARDTAAHRFVWNAYNRARRVMKVIENGSSWTYSTAAFRPMNNSTANRLDFVVGLAGDAVRADVHGMCTTSVDSEVAVGIGLDSTTVNSANLLSGYLPDSGMVYSGRATFDGVVSVGRHWLQAQERGYGAGTQTWYGTNSSDNRSIGITGSIWA